MSAHRGWQWRRRKSLPYRHSPPAPFCPSWAFERRTYHMEGPKSTNTLTASSMPPLFTTNGHDDDEASRLLSSLTGIAFAGDCVANVAVKKARKNRAHFKDSKAQGISKGETDMCTGCSTDEEARHPKDDQIFVPQPVKECPRHFEKALDTTDLSFWMYTVVPDGSRNQEEESYSDADSEELERRAAFEKVPEKVVTATADDHGPLDERTKREEFRARVKESMGFVRMRTEMLQDLSLGEALKDESPILPGGGDTSFMSGPSVLLKHSRKLAGLLHTEEQALSLQDLYQWFQNIGKTLGEEALGASPKSTLHNQLEKLRSLHVAQDLVKATEEAKPPPTPSPHELLKQVEHDVRDHLANLYQGKNFIMSHQAEVWANLESSNEKEAMLHATMERLQNMEAAYEILGTTILQSLKEAERMEEEFHVLQSELVSNGCPLMTISHKKSKKSSHKGKKKGASTDSDGMNPGSSRSESSSAQSSSRRTNPQTEETKVALEQPSNKAADEKNPASGGKIDSKSASKTKKKKTSHKTEKKKGEKPEDGNDGVIAENKKRLKSTSEEASTPVQASSPSLSSVPEVPPLSVAAKEEKGSVPDSVKGSDNAPPNEGSVSNASTAIEGVQMQEGAKATSSDTKGQSVEGRPIFSEPSRSSKSESDFVSVENKLIIPKVSINVLDVKPSDSASVQVLPKAKRKSRRLAAEVSKDEIVQTDDVAILSLEDCDVEALQARDYQAVDVKDLLERMKKLQKQLQFWRTKNWAEKHTGQGHMIPLPTYNQFTKVDVAPDMGMLCYYNSRTGVHVMKNVADLDASMQQSIIHLVDGPSESPKAPQ
ncbi:hypothetical protein GOP47_0029311 [Adiantum capillus-veneris]|nr:hypothetical protein GOP47_0029311 [Adiantum capillus-veneris]